MEEKNKEENGNDEYFRFEGLDPEACSAIDGELDENGKCLVRKIDILHKMLLGD